MLKLSVILSEIAEPKSDAACSIPDRKLAGAAIAAASKIRLIMRPPDVSATTEPTPPEPELLTAAWASADSAGIARGIGGGGICSGVLVGIDECDPDAPKLRPKKAATLSQRLSYVS